MRLTLWACFALALLLCQGCQGDDSPGFFLKVAKNVPRLGRRSSQDMDGYFFKNMKVIPRIGRSGDHPEELPDSATAQQWGKWSKRALMSPAAISAATAADREYTVVQPVNSNTLIELLDRNAISSDNVKFVHWKDFDRALQSDPELFGKVSSLGRKPDQHLKEDLGFGSYVPLFKNANDDGTDYVFYNKDADTGMYAGKYDRDFLHYNHLK